MRLRIMAGEHAQDTIKLGVAPLAVSSRPIEDRLPLFVFVGLPSISDPDKPTGFVAQGQQWVEGWVWQQCDRCGSVALAAGKPGRCQACREGATSEEAQKLQAARHAAQAARFEPTRP